VNEEVDNNSVDISNSLYKIINTCKENDENNVINISNSSNKSDEIIDKNEQNNNDLYIENFPNKKIRNDMSKFERTFKQNENKIKNDTDKKCGADLYSK